MQRPAERISRRRRMFLAKSDKVKWNCGDTDQACGACSCSDSSSEATEMLGTCPRINPLQHGRTHSSADRSSRWCMTIAKFKLICRRARVCRAVAARYPTTYALTFTTAQSEPPPREQSVRITYVWSETGKLYGVNMSLPP